MLLIPLFCLVLRTFRYQSSTFSNNILAPCSNNFPLYVFSRSGAQTVWARSSTHSSRRLRSSILETTMNSSDVYEWGYPMGHNILVLRPSSVKWILWWWWERRQCKNKISRNTTLGQQKIRRFPSFKKYYPMSPFSNVRTSLHWT